MSAEKTVQSVRGGASHRRRSRAVAVGAARRLWAPAEKWWARRCAAPTRWRRSARRADVAICAAGLPDGDGVQTAAQLTAGDCPWCSSQPHREALWSARGRPASWPTAQAAASRGTGAALDLAIARFAETRQLKQTLEDRKVIERAKGTLMARFGLTEDDAFKRLRRAAMDSRKPMVEVARALLVSESVIS